MEGLQAPEQLIVQYKIDLKSFYAGQLTVPGPGVPPSIISGQIVADYILKHNS